MSFVARHRNGGHRRVGARVLVVGEHLPHVHLVDVVSPEDADELRVLVVDDVLALPDGIGRASVPRLSGPLLGGNRLDELVEHWGEAPVPSDVLFQGRALVLREDFDARHAGVDEVRQDDVDDAVAPRERHRGLRAVERQRIEALALAPREHHDEHLIGVEVRQSSVHARVASPSPARVSHQRRTSTGCRTELLGDADQKLRGQRAVSFLRERQGFTFLSAMRSLCPRLSPASRGASFQSRVSAGLRKKSPVAA